MDRNVAQIYSLDSQRVAKDNYRDYSLTITVFQNDSILFKNTFTIDSFPQIGDKEFYRKAITHNTWIEDYNKENKEIKFTHIIGVPETDWSYKFIITVDNKGNYKSELEEIE